MQHQDCVSVGTVETLSSLESVSVARGLIIALGATATDADDTNDSEATKRSARSKNFKVPNAVASRRGTQSAKVQGKKVPTAQVKTELVPIKIQTKTFSGMRRMLWSWHVWDSVNLPASFGVHCGIDPIARAPETAIHFTPRPQPIPLLTSDFR